MKALRGRTRVFSGLIAAGLVAAALSAWFGIEVGWSQAIAQGPAPPAGVSPAPSVVTSAGQTIQFNQAVPAPGRYGGFVYQAHPAPNTPYTPGQLVVTTEQAQAVAANEQKTRELLGKYSATQDQAEKAKVVESLTAAVSEQFDARQEIRQEELKRLEEQLKKLRELHDRRVAEKSQIIQDRVRQLLRDADGLGWGNDEGRAYYSSSFEWAPKGPIFTAPSAVNAAPAAVPPVAR